MYIFCNRRRKRWKEKLEKKEIGWFRMEDRKVEKNFTSFSLQYYMDKTLIFKKRSVLAMTFLLRKNNSKNVLRKNKISAMVGLLLILVISSLTVFWTRVLVWTRSTSRVRQKCYKFLNSYPSHGILFLKIS